MTMAATLTEASGLSYQQLSLAAAAGTLKTKLLAFINAIDPLFDDNVPKDRPVGNWIIPMRAIQSSMPSTGSPFSMIALEDVVGLVYRITIACQTQITSFGMLSSKGVAMLAAWNTQFGT